MSPVRELEDEASVRAEKRRLRLLEELLVRDGREQSRVPLEVCSFDVELCGRRARPESSKEISGITLDGVSVSTALQKQQRAHEHR